MNEVFTMAKGRKDGKWTILAGPDEPYQAHLDARRKLVEKGNFSDDYSEIILGRMEHKSPHVRFQTVKEFADAEKAKQDIESMTVKSNTDAKERQKKLMAEREKKTESDHKSAVETQNKINDAIRTQKDKPAVK